MSAGPRRLSSLMESLRSMLGEERWREAREANGVSGGDASGTVVSFVRGPGEGDPEIRGIATDSRQVGDGYLFIARQGVSSDGHEYLPRAFAAGAVAALVELGHELPELPEGAVVWEAPTTRTLVAPLAAAFHGPLAEGLESAAVTGTNGKTTTTYILESILRHAGRRPGTLGTVEYRFEDWFLPAPLTTPDPVVLWRTLEEFGSRGASHLLMEVSSHGLHQGRVAGLEFDVAAFTNISPDHLDYHQTLQDYIATKSRLFSEHLRPSGVAIVNGDDPAGELMAEASPAPVWRYGVGEGRALDLHSRRWRAVPAGMEVELVTPAGILETEIPLMGEFNLYNVLAAAGMALAIGVGLEDLRAGLRDLPQVPGRMERIAAPDGINLLVDYAHTTDALRRALSALRGSTAGRLLVVFGCGGDRDRTKRAEMGRAACELADITVVTTDNPRSEQPEAIVAEILDGMAGQPRLEPGDLPRASGGYVLIPDRGEAIRTAVGSTGPGDTVLIAGKGHEPYQIVGDERLPFDDRVTVTEAARELR